MSREPDLNQLPPDLPVPEDDGACDHLTGMTVPPIALPATDGTTVDLSELPGTVVVYIYPRTGRPDQPVPTGWDDIPGARGCTPQSCAFRDHHAELQQLDAAVYGLSTQDTEYQREAVERLHLPFSLLSDEQLRFARALNLPTFTVEGMTLIKRLTLIAREGRIVKVFYPVFPPDQNAEDVITWLRENLAEQAKELGIPIFGIALTEAADFQLIQSVAQASGGDYYRVLAASDIPATLEQIRSRIEAAPAETQKELQPEPIANSLCERLDVDGLIRGCDKVQRLGTLFDEPLPHPRLTLLHQMNGIE
jgi:peroxiredoxin